MLFRSARLFPSGSSSCNGARRCKQHFNRRTTSWRNNRMKNIIPSVLDDLFAFAEKAADGLHALQSSLGVMHNTETLQCTDLDAARSANNSYQAAKTARLA